ncbi:hypothetical protein LENED_001787 [Lentinula edodes]|uniref:Uncharacterized protein n=1 Tax=Lentinula edodes TaxID=5353 RepID=A0A1Q3DZ68_LENED|nr:hypothetical protein LENED_001787 [Lentinula edodes]
MVMTADQARDGVNPITVTYLFHDVVLFYMKKMYFQEGRWILTGILLWVLDLMISISTVQFVPEHSVSSPEPKLFERLLPPQAHMSIHPSTLIKPHHWQLTRLILLMEYHIQLPASCLVFVVEIAEIHLHTLLVEITTRKGDVRIEGLSAAHVLRDQSQIPPANSRTDRGTPFHTPGSHSAIAGHQFGPAPNVLMGARDFRSQGGDFRSGSFSAVAGNRIVYVNVPPYNSRSMNDDNNPEVILDIEGPAATLEAEDGDVPLKDNGALIVNRRRDAYIGPSVHGPNNSHPNTIRLRRAQPTQSQRTDHPNVTSSVQENYDPTVLSQFDGVIPEAIYGSASFSAVGGIQDIRNKNISLKVTKCTQMDVLPNLNGGSFPKPTANRFDDGQHSAVAGKPLIMQDPTNLLAVRGWGRRTAVNKRSSK